MGLSIQQFNDFMATTVSSILTGPEQMVNEAAKLNYFFSRMLRGRDASEVVQGGTEIEDEIMFDDASTALDYKPNETFTYENPQVVDTITRPWRYTTDHMSWTNQEVIQNADSRFTRANRRVRVKHLKHVKERRLWTSLLNHIDDSSWASPHGQSSEMEDDNGRKPMSIPAYVTEDTTNYHADGWTTIMGVDPATESKWRNKVSLYDYADPDDSDGDRDGLFNGFDDMLESIKFIPPGYKDTFFEPLKMDPGKCVIACSKAGKNLVRDQLRAHNDTLVSKQDPAYNDPKYSGYEIVHVSDLNDAELYTDGASSFVGELDASVQTSGPRFYWLNLNYLKPIWHTTQYFVKEDPFRHPNQPFTWICVVDCWRQLWCASRQRQGIVAPGA